MQSLYNVRHFNRPHPIPSNFPCDSVNHTHSQHFLHYQCGRSGSLILSPAEKTMSRCMSELFSTPVSITVNGTHLIPEDILRGKHIPCVATFWSYIGCFYAITCNNNVITWLLHNYVMNYIYVLWLQVSITFSICFDIKQ